MMRNFLSSATFFRDFFAWQKPVNHGFEAMWTSKHSFMPYRSNHENSGGLLAAGGNMYFVDGHVRWIRLDDGLRYRRVIRVGLVPSLAVVVSRSDNHCASIIAGCSSPETPQQLLMNLSGHAHRFFLSKLTVFCRLPTTWLSRGKTKTESAKLWISQRRSNLLPNKEVFE